MTKSLNDFIKDNSKFLSLQDGETFEGTYKDYKIGPNQFDPTKEVLFIAVCYPDGKETCFKTGSTRVARLIADKKAGDKIKIKRLGTGTNTKYEIL